MQVKELDHVAIVLMLHKMFKGPFSVAIGNEAGQNTQWTLAVVSSYW